MQGHCGVPEAPSGYPKSPPSQSNVEGAHRTGGYIRARSPTACSATKGASSTIARECERLLCGDMRRIFLGGRLGSPSVSRSMGSIRKIGNNNNSNKKNENHLGAAISGVSEGYDSDDSDDYDYSNSTNNNNNDDDDDGHSFSGVEKGDGDDMRFIEVWDYVGGTSFRGFIADKELARGKVEKTLFLFFEHVAGTQLKHGYASIHPHNPFRHLLIGSAG